MAYRVEITTGAQRELKKLSQDLRAALFERIASLQDDPYQPGAEKISEVKHGYRVRAGDYRIAYVVVEDETVLVARVGHRSEVYRHIIDALGKAAARRQDERE